jgi:hypothetical protein
MSNADKTNGMKSAYELALERLDRDGIERPREEGLDPALRDEIAEIRSRTEAGLAKLEILLRDRLQTLHDPVERADAQKEYAIERQRLERQRDQKIAKLRGGD